MAKEIENALSELNCSLDKPEDIARIREAKENENGEIEFVEAFPNGFDKNSEKDQKKLKDLAASDSLFVYGNDKDKTPAHVSSDGKVKRYDDEAKIEGRKRGLLTRIGHGIVRFLNAITFGLTPLSETVKRYDRDKRNPFKPPTIMQKIGHALVRFANWITLKKIKSLNKVVERHKKQDHAYKREDNILKAIENGKGKREAEITEAAKRYEAAKKKQEPEADKEKEKENTAEKDKTEEKEEVVENKAPENEEKKEDVVEDKALENENKKENVVENKEPEKEEKAVDINDPVERAKTRENKMKEVKIEQAIELDFPARDSKKEKVVDTNVLMEEVSGEQNGDHGSSDSAPENPDKKKKEADELKWQKEIADNRDRFVAAMLNSKGPNRQKLMDALSDKPDLKDDEINQSLSEAYQNMEKYKDGKTLDLKPASEGMDWLRTQLKQQNKMDAQTFVLTDAARRGIRMLEKQKEGKETGLAPETKKELEGFTKMAEIKKNANEWREKLNDPLYKESMVAGDEVKECCRALLLEKTVDKLYDISRTERGAEVRSQMAEYLNDKKAMKPINSMLDMLIVSAGMLEKEAMMGEELDKKITEENAIDKMYDKMSLQAKNRQNTGPELENSLVREEEKVLKIPDSMLEKGAM